MVLFFLPGFWCPFCLSLFLQTFTCFRIIPSHSRHLHVCPFWNGCVHLHLRLFSEHFRPLTDSHVCFRLLPCIFERVRPILNTWVRLTTIPSEFQHSHPSDYPLGTLAAVFMRFRPSSDNWVHFSKKIKMMFSWDASPSKRRKGREKKRIVL